MRSLLLATTMLMLPMAAIAQQQCIPQEVSEQTYTLRPPVDPVGPLVPLLPPSLPDPARAMRPDTSPVSALVAPDVQSTSLDAAAAMPRSRMLPRMDDTQVAASPALTHFAALGSVLSDLGTSHGLQSFVAVNDGQFLSFVLAPDGQAVVQGLLTDLSLPQLKAIAGNKLTELPTLHQMPSVFLRNGDHFQVFYVSPDEQRLIPGIMWDAAGKDLTREQIAGIPGTTPTVIIGQAPEGTTGAIPAVTVAPPSTFNEVSTLLKRAHGGSLGPDDALEMTMFIDPLCPFSVQAVNALSPLARAGRLKLSVIPVSFIDREDNGMSTIQALRLLSLPENTLVSAWARGDAGRPSTVVADARDRLDANMEIARSLRVRGTPTLLWHNADGSLGRADSLPRDLASVVAQAGG